jgi:hypothetical protein
VPTGHVRPKAPRTARCALAALVLLAVGPTACYSTTPHRAQVAAVAAPRDCADAITDVFARSGFVQLPTPSNLSMFFSPRMNGPYSAFLVTGTGVGVTIDPAGQGGRDCRMTIEALSADVNCADEHLPKTCGGVAAPMVGSSPNVNGMPRCSVTAPVGCPMSYAPGADNDAAVDELARRLRERLGPRASVN